MMGMFLYYILLGTAVTLGGVLVLLAVSGLYILIDNYRSMKRFNKTLREEKDYWMNRATTKLDK